MGENDPSLSWDQMVVVGRVARPHGLRGQVVVNPDTDFVESRYRAGGVLYVSTSGGVRGLRILAARFQAGRPVISLDGVPTVAEAAELAGCELRVPESALAPLPEDVYYRHTLVGCLVWTTDGQLVGPVVEVQGVAGACRLLVKSADTGDEVDIPLAEPICVRIDPAAKTVVVDPPAGLLDLNERSAGGDVE